MEVLHEMPVIESFTPLSQHQAQTPESFFSGPPVLYYHSPAATLVVSRLELQSTEVFSGLVDTSGNSHSAGINGRGANGDETENQQDAVISGIDIWVTSKYFYIYNFKKSNVLRPYHSNFMLFRPSKNRGVAIPYPSISLHAIQRLQMPSASRPTESQGLFMQLVSSDGFDDHDPEGTVSLTLIPSTVLNPASISPLIEGAEDRSEQCAEAPLQTPTQALFAAVSACANLHPDPVSGSDEELDTDNVGLPLEYQSTNTAGGLPPPVPGSGGWITADNMNDFFDEDGNWRGSGLGPGAGIVREREDIDGVDGDEAHSDADETKWRRTE
ncbi:hypothetical protein MMC20_001006 [Loxospora ochrophaea]|nr:hypothetical protein [Loxospora ochrophaea]